MDTFYDNEKHGRTDSTQVENVTKYTISMSIYIYSQVRAMSSDFWSNETTKVKKFSRQKMRSCAKKSILHVIVLLSNLKYIQSQQENTYYPGVDIWMETLS